MEYFSIKQVIDKFNSMDESKKEYFEPKEPHTQILTSYSVSRQN